VTQANATTPHNTRPIPAGYHTVTPWIISKDTADVIEFVKAAFGAQELARVYGVDGKIGHAECRIGDSVVMMFDARGHWPAAPSFLRLYVEDGDAVFRQALNAGATTVTEMTTLFFGDRVGRVRDPYGNIWWIQTHLEDLSMAEMQRRAAQPEHVDAMRYLTDADPFPTP
jgi:PhnB protein